MKKKKILPKHMLLTNSTYVLLYTWY